MDSAKVEPLERRSWEQPEGSLKKGPSLRKGEGRESATDLGGGETPEGAKPRSAPYLNR
jgi:hypothetical protein